MAPPTRFSQGQISVGKMKDATKILLPFFVPFLSGNKESRHDIQIENQPHIISLPTPNQRSIIFDVHATYGGLPNIKEQVTCGREEEIMAFTLKVQIVLSHIRTCNGNGSVKWRQWL